MKTGPTVLAAVALIVAAIALPLAIISILRATHESITPSEPSQTPRTADPDMQSQGELSGSMGMSSGPADHGAPAPMDGVPDATASSGGAVLQPQIEDDTWVYKLTVTPVRWEILPGVRVTAWTYNGLVPGPELRVPYGQHVRIEITNQLPDPTTVHWHGLAVPNSMDGVPGVTQDPIEPGQTFTYEFDAVPAGRGPSGGTFIYHSHLEEDRQLGLGLSGAFIIERPDDPTYDIERTILISEWNLDPATGETRPAMEVEGSLPNYFTLNGKSFPATETISATLGDKVLLRLIGAGQFEHPMHLHGTDFELIAKDGHAIPGRRLAMDTVQVSPGERYDLQFTATEPGRWLLHCHIGHHSTNDGADPGGLMMIVDVAE